MANLEITNVDQGSVILANARFRDELLTFTGAATVAEGTILARLTATQLLVPFVKGGSLGAEIPVAILTFDVTATGAGDLPIRAGVAGEYRSERLIIDADGSAVNIDDVVRDQLRDFGLVPLDVLELNILDNQ